MNCHMYLDARVMQADAKRGWNRKWLKATRVHNTEFAGKFRNAVKKKRKRAVQSICTASIEIYDNGTIIGDLKIRPATYADSESILSCLSAAFAPFRDRYTFDAFADTVLDGAALRSRMQSMRVLIAIANNQVVGTVSGEARRGGEGHLRGMAVLPQCKRLGIASQLLKAIEAWLGSQGCEYVTLDTTLPLEAAMHFYEKHGYTSFGVLDDFPMSTRFRRFYMRKELRTA